MSPDHSHEKASIAARDLERRVWRSLESGDLKRAVQVCRQLNADFPNYAPGWHAASHVAMKAGALPAALQAIERALAEDPGVIDWQLQRGRCLAKLGRFADCEAVIEELEARNLDTVYALSSLAMLMTEVNRREDAVEVYERAASLAPEDARIRFNIAALHRTLGNIDAAEAGFDKAIRLDPGNYEAYKLRAELRKQSDGANHIAELEQLLGDGIEDFRGEANICYALAKECEDIGDWQRSFDYVERGAAVRRRNMQYDVERDLRTMEAIRNAFGPEVFVTERPGCDSKEPVFVLGLPRTGTTLVERILGAHSDVFAAGELPNFALQVVRRVKAEHDTGQRDRDDLVAQSANIDFEALGRAYVDSTRPFTGHTPRFVDKMPLNYLYVGLLRLALPNAKIVALRRHPLDSCYAIYKTLFTDAYPFSYDLVELARYIVAYHALMDHWDAVLPGVVHTIDYEQLVADVETNTRQLLDYCDLEFQPQCLEFHESRAFSTTASAVQVRQPVYQTSVGRWRHVEPFLEPAVDVFRQAGLIDAQNRFNVA